MTHSWTLFTPFYLPSQKVGTFYSWHVESWLWQLTAFKCLFHVITSRTHYLLIYFLLHLHSPQKSWYRLLLYLFSVNSPKAWRCLPSIHSIVKVINSIWFQSYSHSRTLLDWFDCISIWTGCFESTSENFHYLSFAFRFSSYGIMMRLENRFFYFVLAGRRHKRLILHQLL
jgi:hypothetical protein